jgi:hypothetical protein
LSAKEEIPKLSREYLIQRNEQMRNKNFTAALLAAKARSELIEKSLVERQASFLLITIRQKLLNLPAAYARRILNLTDVNQANRILKEMMISLLDELRELPLKVVDPNWLATVEEDDGK